MRADRRRFLTACAGLAATALARADPKPVGRVVIVGGGWGGLSAARHLRALAPGMEITLVEQQARFHSCPLGNRWLAGRLEDRFLVHDYAPAARAFGYRFLQARATAVDRDRRTVVTSAGPLPYDWLILSVGIRHDYAAWFGDDRKTAEITRSLYPAAYTAGDELAVLQGKVEAFPGGELLMNLPPMPYRCPPAPYERAVAIASRMKARGIRGRLIVLDPNPLPRGFRRVFEERYRDWITYVPDAAVKTVDPFAKRVRTEFDEYRFDDAILMPPQQAGDLVHEAGLSGIDRDGRPTGWADQDPLGFQSRADGRIFVIGDSAGPVSPLFGHYPKSGHMASRQGRIVAARIAARAAGAEAPPLLPESVCFVHQDFGPAEMARLETRYRLRGDGLIEQSAKQSHDPNPRDEDLAWAAGMFAELLGSAPGG